MHSTHEIVYKHKKALEKPQGKNKSKGNVWTKIVSSNDKLPEDILNHRKKMQERAKSEEKTKDSHTKHTT